MDNYAVIGNPIEHSKSPLLHQLFAQATGQKIRYEKILAPLDGFRETADAFRQAGGKGLNVTMPFKLEAFHYVDDMNEQARRAQAVNTIIFKDDGSSYGANTDGIGLVRDLTQNKNIALKNKKIVLLGAGGAVRGCLLPLLLENPKQIIIANRNQEKAQTLVADFRGYKNLAYCSYTDLPLDADIIINGTSASLEAALPPLPLGLAAQAVCCYDMAYGNKLTAFEQWAKQQGAKNFFNGLGMLIEQGAESFYLWHGIRPRTQGIAQKLLSHVS
jgi:shikimate dehydrogenase